MFIAKKGSCMLYPRSEKLKILKKGSVFPVFTARFLRFHMGTNRWISQANFAHRYALYHVPINFLFYIMTY